MYAALRSFTQCLYKNDHNLIYRYLIAKMLYIFLDCLKGFLTIRTFPYNLQETSATIKLGLWIFECVWTLFDFYFMLILLMIYNKTRKGFHGVIRPLQKQAIFDREIMLKIPTGLLLECRGIKIKDDKTPNLAKKQILSFFKAFGRVWIFTFEKNIEFCPFFENMYSFFKFHWFYGFAKILIIFFYFWKKTFLFF